MELYKYNSTTGKITMVANGRPFTLDFQARIFTGKQEEIILNMMKKTRSIRRTPADQMEMAEYIRFNGIGNQGLKNFSNEEIKAEYFRRFPGVKVVEAPVTDSGFAPAAGNGSFTSENDFGDDYTPEDKSAQEQANTEVSQPEFDFDQKQPDEIPVIGLDSVPVLDQATVEQNQESPVTQEVPNTAPVLEEPTKGKGKAAKAIKNSL